jgi:hypothetical protein
MSDTPTVKSIYECIIDFQSQMPIIKKMQDNPFFKSKYADLANIQTQIRESLANSGLGYVQLTTEKGLETRLFTLTGDSISFTYPLSFTKVLESKEETKNKDRYGNVIYQAVPVLNSNSEISLIPLNSQEIGSALTYAKRYSLVALLGLIIEGDDDDGNEASGKTTQSETQKPITKAQAKKTVETLYPELWQAISSSENVGQFDDLARQLFKIQNDDENRKELWFKLANHAKKYGFEYSKETKQFFKITD